MSFSDFELVARSELITKCFQVTCTFQTTSVEEVLPTTFSWQFFTEHQGWGWITWAVHKIDRYLIVSLGNMSNSNSNQPLYSSTSVAPDTQSVYLHSKRVLNWSVSRRSPTDFQIILPPCRLDSVVWGLWKGQSSQICTSVWVIG